MVLPASARIPGLPVTPPGGGLDVDLTPGALVVGDAESKPTALALPSYGQELRRKGVQLAWGKARSAIINDRNDIVSNGTADMGAVINTYLAEYKAAGFSAVYFDGGTYGIGATPLIHPGQIIIEGSTSPKTSFNARAGATDIVRIAGNNAIMRHFAIWQGNTVAQRGISLDGVTAPELSHFSITGVPDNGTAIYGGGLENIWIHHYHIQVSGGLGIGTAVDIIQGNSSNTATYYGADNLSVIEAGAVSGNGILMRVSGSCRIRDHDFEGAQRTPCSGRVILGQDIVGPNGTGLSVNGEVRFEDNYFELSPLEAGYTDLVPCAIHITDWATARIHGNTIYGGANYFAPGKGSAAIVYGNRASLTEITGNKIARWDIGIKNLKGDSSGTTLIAGNAMPAGQVNTEVTGGFTGYTNNRGEVGYVQTSRNHLFKGGSIAQTVFRHTSAPTSIDLSSGNIIELNFAGTGSLLPTNARPGQRILLSFVQGGTTLTASGWGLFSGVNETPPAGTIKEFVVDYNGSVREIVTLDARKMLPAVQTAAFTATANATVYPCDATAGAFNAQLPDGRNFVWNPRTQLTFRKIDSSANAVTIILSNLNTGASSIDGAANYPLKRAGEWVTLQANNTGSNVDVQWSVVASGRNHKPAAALTAADATAIDATWDAAEQGVVENLRTRVNELESRLQALGLLP